MDSDSNIYTVVTFAPVQGFIEKSRKLRDLYGSSYLLSLLSWSVCTAANRHNYTVISPALPNIAQGLPNLILIAGTTPFPHDLAHQSFSLTWSSAIDTCRAWIAERVQSDDWTYGEGWQRAWSHWRNHAWEFFYASGVAGDSISAVRQKLNNTKRSRDWVGVNWTGESSTLSGADAIVRPGMGREGDLRQLNYGRAKLEATAFARKLSAELGEAYLLRRKNGTSGRDRETLKASIGQAFLDPDEELSIPELVKRLITHEAIGEQFVDRLTTALDRPAIGCSELSDLLAKLQNELNPDSFRDLNRLAKPNAKMEKEPKFWTGWFQGDGDSVGQYLERQQNSQSQSTAAQNTQAFSALMRTWGHELVQQDLPPGGRTIYAGGDDFLGVLYRPQAQILAKDCVNWLQTFSRDVWHGNSPKPITVSVGFVWCSPRVPQRDVLQHCKAAEQSAKQLGRDRLALRILFAGGNTLEWVCPWHWLEKDLLSGYRDREGGQNWTHFYNDVVELESRHAFEGNPIEVATALFEVYFPDFRQAANPLSEQHWWNVDGDEGRVSSGILGDPQRFLLPDRADEAIAQLSSSPNVRRALNQWVTNLAKVGFHLCQ
ncbi:type III-B CRISPR-associated protein Cas10/Cmr2 [Synechococcus sp. PCC 7336]|uniref:Cas10/Cmr2 second palm domain-containing protein n=1 Tax=Synechococcus sp. PCC 7336 TaxID=195250 RepID=UPI0003492445|nr:type III-B CRISPR-associated protein Cas10/Cmr2 [Synechococcus sp. PCC 7336]